MNSNRKTDILVGMFLFAANYVNVSERQQQEWRSFDEVNSVSLDFEAATNWLKVNMRNDDVVATRVTRNSPKVSVLTSHKDFAGTYESNLKFGLWTRFNINGTLIAEASYKKDKKDGTWFVYNDQGAKLFKMEYKDGEKTGTWTQWDEAGNIVKSTNYASL